MRPVLLPNVGLGVGSLYIDLDNPGGATLRLISTNPPTFQEVGAGGSGDVTGPVSSTNGAMARWSGTGGDTLQDGPVPGATGTSLLGAATVAAALTTLELTEVADTRVAQLGAGTKGTNLAIGDGQGMFFVCPSFMNGWNLTAVRGEVDVAGTTGTMDVQIRRVRSGASADMLSTKLTFDSTENTTSTAATPAVINTSNDDMATGDRVYVDVDAVQTTPATGVLNISLTFTKP